MKLFLTIIAVILPFVTLRSQTTPDEFAKQFIDKVVDNSPVLSDVVAPEELRLSERLGISYEGIVNKFLIAYDLDSTITSSIKNNKLTYQAQWENLDGDYRKLIFSVPQQLYQHAFFFKNEKLISPVSYYTRNWQKRENEHFKFLISDTTLFNHYSIKRLEDFLTSAFRDLKFTQQERELLGKEKIYYYLCRDENEIEQITGFRTLGMYIIAYDYVVTTYNCHYHELLHLLVNFKLRHLPLYTHPFFQEGLAVALGGRGGKEPNVILDVGYYMQKSGMLDYRELLDRRNYLKNDPSLTYPVSGLYNAFLLRELGADAYLKLYRNYSANEEMIDTIVIDEHDLPLENIWNSFLDAYPLHPAINFGEKEEGSTIITQNERASIMASDTSYSFRVKDTLLLTVGSPIQGYRSKKFAETFPGRNYAVEKYLIIADSNEINVYNLYTNNLIANFVTGFSIPPMEVPRENNLYIFNVKKSVFDEGLPGVTIH